jgi:hypothetical protein
MQEFGAAQADISYDLVMDDDMSFVEGTYRLPGSSDWCVLIFSKRPIEQAVWRRSTWDSGVRGMNFHVPESMRLNASQVESLMSVALGIAHWRRVRGPDSMNLR